MSRQVDGTRRFMKALATMMLVACSLPCAGGEDGSSAAAVQQRAKALQEAGSRGGGTVGGEALAVADGPESPGLLLDRGTALLLGGNSKDAVGVLDAAMAAWEEEVSYGACSANLQERKSRVCELTLSYGRVQGETRAPGYSVWNRANGNALFSSIKT